jgi:type II secretory pathway predicted ATPase ExeA
MSVNIQQYFGFRKMPFSSNISIVDFYKLESMLKVKEDIDFAIESSMDYALVGEIGSGKSSILDYIISETNKQNRFRMIKVVGGKWKMTEFLRTVLNGFNYSITSNRPSIMLNQIGKSIDTLQAEGIFPVICIDETELLDPEVFVQLHLLSQQGKKNPMPIVMVGQEDLLGRLRQPLARPLCSRIGSSYRLESLTQEEALGYLNHHLSEIAKVSPSLINDNAKLAIAQNGANIMRNMNNLALKSLKVAMQNNRQEVTMADVSQAKKQGILQEIGMF